MQSHFEKMLDFEYTNAKFSFSDVAVLKWVNCVFWVVKGDDSGSILWVHKYTRLNNTKEENKHLFKTFLLKGLKESKDEW